MNFSGWPVAAILVAGRTSLQRKTAFFGFRRKFTRLRPHSLPITPEPHSRKSRMSFRTRWIVPVVLLAALFAPWTAVWARSPVLPIPSARQPQSILSPKSGVPKNPIMAPNTKSGQKKSWSPFGSWNRSLRSR
jgi:hypothetical protein